jgi:hypothetical protein
MLPMPRFEQESRSIMNTRHQQAHTMKPRTYQDTEGVKVTISQPRGEHRIRAKSKSWYPPMWFDSIEQAEQWLRQMGYKAID